MPARILGGRAVAQRLRDEYRIEIAAWVARGGPVPRLAVLLVGDDAASRVYVDNKARACAGVGISSTVIAFPETVEQEQLLDRIRTLNEAPDVHGILVQLPLPEHIDVAAVVEAISVRKDVDGFHLYNMGGLMVGRTVFSPCTPFGVQKLLEAERIPVAGQNVVVVGASNIVGKPTAMMLMQQDATVCICHKKTRDLAQFTILADILVVAAGVPELIKADMVRTGAVVIDVGINRLPSGQIVGDVDFSRVAAKVAAITPVPGGVGPMTVAMLLHNTLRAAQNQR